MKEGNKTSKKKKQVVSLSNNCNTAVSLLKSQLGAKLQSTKNKSILTDSSISHKKSIKNIQHTTVKIASFNDANVTTVNKLTPIEDLGNVTEKTCLTSELSYDYLFNSLNLKESVLSGLSEAGFRYIQPMQKQALDILLARNSLFLQSPSGTGKTLVFTVLALQVSDSNKTKSQVLIISPTRELAKQTYDVFVMIGKYTKLKISLAVSSSADSKSHVYSGTPTGIKSLITSFSLFPSDVHLCILDEADELCSSNLKKQVLYSLEKLSDKCQKVFVSATRTPEVDEILTLHCKHYSTLFVKAEKTHASTLDQYYIKVLNEEQKFLCLTSLYSKLTITQAVIFLNSRNRVAELFGKLNSLGYDCIMLHGGMKFKDRTNALEKFSSAFKRILITTNLFGRGLDIARVNVVINYDLPLSNEFYVHRIGRSGRFHRKGVSISLVLPSDQNKIQQIEKHYKIKMKPLPKKVENLV